MSNLDYTLLDELLLHGGILKRSVDLDTGEVLFLSQTSSGDGPAARPQAGPSAPLSKAHIRPFLEWRQGARLLRVSKGGESEQVGGGRRGSINGFTNGARRRLMQTIASVRRDAELPLFITLTYPDVFPSPKESKRHLKIFFQRLGRAFSHGSIWKLEPQERGAPHYHILTWGCDRVDLSSFVPSTWFEIAGGGDEKHLIWHCGGFGNSHCVQYVQSFNGVWAYASKYLGKTFEVSGWQEKWTGRYWGIVNRSNVPFGELVRVDVDRKDVLDVMRYQRRFAGLKSRSLKSQTVYCDADQWVRKLNLGGDFLDAK